jgi:diketogulonate reductase-like aldo/keto reductase
MGRQTIELMQIHNLVDWKTHLQTLKDWKAEGRIKYIGITHYTDAAHDALVKIMEAEKIDFVQFNYSLFNRHAEKRLLPAAVNNGVATLINRPFGEGKIFAKVQGKSLPSWATAMGISGWSQFFLKFIIAHPAVSCVIPATGNPLHAAHNMEAAEGTLPDAELRSRMASFAATL